MAILAKGTAFHERQPPLAKSPGTRGRKVRRPGHNLLLRLRDYRDDVLRFIADFAVPFTNNQTEHQQLGRTRPTHDEAAYENLGHLLYPRGSAGLRRHQVCHLHGQKAWAQHPGNPDPVTNADHCTPLTAGPYAPRYRARGAWELQNIGY